MTTPLFQLSSDFNDVVDEKDDSFDSSLQIQQEYIDEPPYVSSVDLRGIGDSCTTLDQLEKTALSGSFSMEDRFLAFSTMYASPYHNKNQRCIFVLLQVLEDESLSVEQRFSWLTKLKLSSDSIDVCLYGYVYWFYNHEDPLLYKLICAQFMLTHPIHDYPFIKTHIKFSQQFLYHIAKRESISVQLRSEAADLLIRLGTPNFRQAGNDIIQSLGQLYVPSRNRTIYTNSQNIHSIESVSSILSWLQEEKKTVTMDDIYQWCKEYKEYKDNCNESEVVLESVKRIMMDTGIYEGIYMTDIICIIFQRIQVSQHKKELEKRFIEELIDMNGWCSSGHVVRLVNVLQGFEEKATIRIPVREEIRSAVYARLSYHMKKSCSKELQEELLLCFCQEDKTLLEEFIETYSPFDELKEEYKNIPYEEFITYYNQSIKEYIG
jgi:hypothetical protein